MKVRADQLLVERGFFDTRARARAAIEAGRVSADGLTVAKPSEKLAEDAVIEAEPAHPWVGRGALKLDYALGLWPVDVKGAVVIDVGASTGGFTEVCLARGAAHVYAVDVGSGQLHPRLSADERVSNLERTDARGLTRVEIPRQPSLIVCDASFISLTKVLPTPLELAAPRSQLVTLVKPQFEAQGPQSVGKKGVVKDFAQQQAALEKAKTWLESIGWVVQGVDDSPIKGADGNLEFLVWAVRGPDAASHPAANEKPPED